jgi:LacI family transcriptional regulator
MPQIPHPVTIRDVAKLAGVSPSTVSRVLSGATHVAMEKRAAVLAAIEQFHYRPNVVAQGLARGRSRAIGVLTQDVTSAFYGGIQLGIAQGFRGSGYQPLFAAGNAVDEAEEALDMLLDRRVDSLILVGGRVPDDRLAQVSASVPLLAIGRSINGLEDHCLHVANLEGAREATRHLVGLGHRRIAHVTGIPGHRDAVDRYDGYVRALTDAGLPVDPRLVVAGNFEEQSGAHGVQKLLARRVRFTALFAGNDQMAYGALQALARRGLRVPQDVSVVGFDDQRGAAYTIPALTTVRQPAVEMGRAAAEAVLRLLRGEPLSLPTFSTELVVRESTRRLGRAPAARRRRRG